MFSYDPTNPLIVQSDHTLLLETNNPRFAEARAAIAPFAELDKSPEYMHTYRVSPLTLWSAAASGLQADTIVARLHQYAKYPIPDNVLADLRAWAGRWGRLQLVAEGHDLVLVADDEALLAELASWPDVAALLGPMRSGTTAAVPLEQRGELKHILAVSGWPVQDLAGYAEGEAFSLALDDGFVVRPYQQEAAEAFYGGGGVGGGSGVVVLPPGAGKTLVGIVAMMLVGQSTLILTTNTTSVQQWRRELLRRTSATEDDVAEYTGERRRIAPITVATYQMLTYRSDRDGSFPHMRLFGQRNWGLIVYDEVHALPAPVFRATAAIQARRRLGLTATLVREDGREVDVFALIGPKKYEAPWRDLEQRGWIAEAACVEVLVPLPADMRMAYATAEPHDMYRIAAENRAKQELLRAVLRAHAGEPALVIGRYISQIEAVAADLKVPLVTGKTPQRERERLFEQFRTGALRGPYDAPLLVISQVGNFALDLPDAALLVQVSGTYGSRQEEAQRLGRVLRPKADGRRAHFYTLVTRDTREQDYSHKRQLFLAEQGYTYQIIDAGQLLGTG